MKQIIINLGDNLEIKSEDLTLADIIKGMALFAATIKEVQKDNPNVKYEDILMIVDQLSNDIIGANSENSKEENSKENKE